MGDSITAGARVDSQTKSYPAQLQNLLGDRYQVQNFGLGSATLLRSGRPNVWQKLDAVRKFQPHWVVVSLGTNDTVSGRRQNWEHIDRFESDYGELIDELAGLSTKPRIVVCTPTAMVLETQGLQEERRMNLAERQPRLQALCRRIRIIAQQQRHKNVSLLELNRVLEGHPEWVTEKDGVHPNADGYKAIAGAVAQHMRSGKPRPNIILFLVDDMGWQDTSVPFHREVTELNRQYHTPHMERLAATGMKFTQAYACSVCSPTRVSLMTGLNAARHRVTNWTLKKNASNDRGHPTLTFPKWNVNGLSPKPGIEKTIHARALPSHLRDAGYHTIHVGKAHFGAIGTPGSDPLNVGFDVNIGGHAAGGPGSFLGSQNFSAVWRNGDRVWDVPGLQNYHGTDIFLTEALTREAIRSMDQAVQEGEPFFLYMAHYAVHVPFAKDTRFYQKYRDAGLDHTEAMYAAMVEGMDKSLGDIIANVERHKISDDTVVLFMSDNGGLSASGRGGKRHTHNRPLSSGKGSAHEGGIRVPMLARWPGITKPGSVTNEPVIIEDFFPTILEIAGASTQIQKDAPIDGRSFTSILKGNPDQTREDRSLYWHFPNHWGPKGPGIGPSSCVRRGPWKLIHYYDGRPLELFNLTKDLGERDNVALQHPKVVSRLTEDLSQYLERVDAQFPIDKVSGEPQTMQPLAHDARQNLP